MWKFEGGGCCIGDVGFHWMVRNWGLGVIGAKRGVYLYLLLYVLTLLTYKIGV